MSDREREEKLTLVEAASCSSCSAVIWTSAGILFFTLATFGTRAFFAGGGSSSMCTRIQESFLDRVALRRVEGHWVILNIAHHLNSSAVHGNMADDSGAGSGGKRAILPWGLTTDTLKPNSVQVWKWKNRLAMLWELMPGESFARPVNMTSPT